MGEVAENVLVGYRDERMSGAWWAILTIAIGHAALAAIAWHFLGLYGCAFVAGFPAIIAAGARGRGEALAILCVCLLFLVHGLLFWVLELPGDVDTSLLVTSWIMLPIFAAIVGFAWSGAKHLFDYTTKKEVFEKRSKLVEVARHRCCISCAAPLENLVS